MSRQFIFPITTGRSGTTYLAEMLRRNLPNAEVHHERAGLLELGFIHPDTSHFTRFNTIGNDAHVRQFWRHRLPGMIERPAGIYAEISHPLFKAGLIENIEPLTAIGRVDFIVLRHDTSKILWSLVNRFDFMNTSFTWLFSLDAHYRNVIVDARPFLPYGAPGHALWYIHEVWTRAAYYRRLLEGHPNVRFHDVLLADITTKAGAKWLLDGLGHTTGDAVLPPPLNITTQFFFGDDTRADCDWLARTHQLDHKALAEQFLRDGRRLSTGPDLSQTG